MAPKSKATEERSLARWQPQRTTKTRSMAVCYTVGLHKEIWFPERDQSLAWIRPNFGKNQDLLKFLERAAKNLIHKYREVNNQLQGYALVNPLKMHLIDFVSIVRKEAKGNRMVIHFQSVGAPAPDNKGNFFVFGDIIKFSYTTVSIRKFMRLCNAPLFLVFDGPYTAKLKPYIDSSALEPTEDDEFLLGEFSGNQSKTDATSLPMRSGFHEDDVFAVFACGEMEDLTYPKHLPLDFFSCCLATPAKALACWYLYKESQKGQIFEFDHEILDYIPGTYKERGSPFGELQWICQAILSEIAVQTLDEKLYQRVCRQDTSVGILVRHYLLARRLMNEMKLHPESIPALPSCDDNYLWKTLEYEVGRFFTSISAIVPTDLLNYLKKMELVYKWTSTHIPNFPDPTSWSIAEKYDYDKRTWVTITIGKGQLKHKAVNRDLLARTSYKGDKDKLLQDQRFSPPTELDEEIDDVDDYEPPKGDTPSFTWDLDNFQHSSYFQGQLKTIKNSIRRTICSTKTSEEREVACHDYSREFRIEVPLIGIGIALHLILSPDLRKEALVCIADGLNLGQWLVPYILRAGLFFYLPKLLSTPDVSNHPVLIYLSARIIAFDDETRVALVKDKHHPGYTFFAHYVKMKAEGDFADIVSYLKNLMKGHDERVMTEERFLNRVQDLANMMTDYLEKLYIVACSIFCLTKYLNSHWKDIERDIILELFMLTFQSLQGLEKVLRSLPTVYSFVDRNAKSGVFTVSIDFKAMWLDFHVRAVQILRLTEICGFRFLMTVLRHDQALQLEAVSSANILNFANNLLERNQSQEVRRWIFFFLSVFVDHINDEHFLEIECDVGRCLCGEFRRNAAEACRYEILVSLAPLVFLSNFSREFHLFLLDYDQEIESSLYSLFDEIVLTLNAGANDLSESIANVANSIVEQIYFHCLDIAPSYELDDDLSLVEEKFSSIKFYEFELEREQISIDKFYQEFRKDFASDLEVIVDEYFTNPDPLTVEGCWGYAGKIELKTFPKVPSQLKESQHTGEYNWLCTKKFNGQNITNVAFSPSKYHQIYYLTEGGMVFRYDYNRELPPSQMFKVDDFLKTVKPLKSAETEFFVLPKPRTASDQLFLLCSNREAVVVEKSGKQFKSVFLFSVNKLLVLDEPTMMMFTCDQSYSEEQGSSPTFALWNLASGTGLIRDDFSNLNILSEICAESKPSVDVISIKRLNSGIFCSIVFSDGQGVILDSGNLEMKVKFRLDDWISTKNAFFQGFSQQHDVSGEVFYVFSISTVSETSALLEWVIDEDGERNLNVEPSSQNVLKSEAANVPLVLNWSVHQKDSSFQLLLLYSLSPEMGFVKFITIHPNSAIEDVFVKQIQLYSGTKLLLYPKKEKLLLLEMGCQVMIFGTPLPLTQRKRLNRFLALKQDRR